MKFGKEFVSQMVQEWQEAYMNYDSLKSILKEISQYKAQHQSTARRASTSTSKGSLRRRLTLYRAYSGLNDNPRESSKSEDEVILIQSVEGEDSKGFYQTMFLRASDDGAEKDLEFFKKLDFEFNKVNAFYKKMVKKVVDEAEELSKQINYLIALRIKVEKIGFTNLDSNETSSTPFTNHGHSSPHMDGNLFEDRNHVAQTNSKTSLEGFRPAPLDVLDHVKINVSPPETPVSTIKGLLTNSKSGHTFNKKELKKAEEQLSAAFTELYRKLRLLKQYR